MIYSLFHLFAFLTYLLLSIDKSRFQQRFKAVNRNGHEENQANGEPEFSERDPSAIFLETSGGRDDRYSGT